MPQPDMPQRLRAYHADRIARAVLLSYYQNFRAAADRDLTLLRAGRYVQGFGGFIRHYPPSDLYGSIPAASPGVIIRAILVKMLRNAKRRKSPPIWANISSYKVAHYIRIRMNNTYVDTFLRRAQRGDFHRAILRASRMSLPPGT